MLGLAKEVGSSADVRTRVSGATYPQCVAVKARALNGQLVRSLLSALAKGINAV